MRLLHVTLITLKTAHAIKDRGKKMRGQDGSQRSRGRYLKPVPKKLKDLIALVNGLPRFGSIEWSFLNPRSLEAQVEAELENDRARENAFFDHHLARLIVEELQMKASSIVVNYVALGFEQGSVTSNRMMKDGGVVGRYSNLWIAKIRLHNIAKLATQQGPYAEKSTLWQQAVPLLVLDEIDEQGIVRVSKDLFTDAIDEEPIEAARIRECAICRRIFFAGRIDAWQCGDPKCKSALSSRLNRNPELRKLYNKARRAKRSKKKEARQS